MLAYRLRNIFYSEAYHILLSAGQKAERDRKLVSIEIEIKTGMTES